MQFKRINKKIIAIALTSFMFTSYIGGTVSTADEIIQSEDVTINESITLDENEIVDEALADGNEISLDETTLEGYEVVVDGKAIKTSPQTINGFVKEDGKWRFYVNNVQAKGWIEYRGIKYYIINTYALPQNMWRTIQGKRYYFNKDGVMIRDQKIKIDGKEYQFNKDGHLVNNDNSKKLGEVTAEQQAIYSLGEKILSESINNGRNVVKTGLFKENGKWYKYENGKKTRGWYTEGDKKYFFLNTLERAQNMWRTINGVRYYFEADGTMVSNKIKYIDGNTYKFNKDGALNTGIKTSLIQKNTNVYADSNGGSSVKGILNKGTGIEIVKVIGNYANVKNSDGSVQGWIQVSSYVSESEKRINSVIAVAKSKLGSTYVWGAEGPNTFDCSGLMLYAFKNGANINLPRVSKQQATVGRAVSRSELKPGDMIFWGSPVHHVGLYIGDGKYIHAPEPGTSVTIANLGSYTSARRVIE